MAKPSYGLVLLAAGASTRMGRPKQLLPIAGKPLLRRIAEIALTAPVSPVVVVLGANADRIASSLDGLSVHIVVNEAWRDGMASSLRTGLQKLIALQPDVAGAVIALGDQPDFSAAHVAKLVDALNRSARSIAATQVRGILMPPALFAAGHFPELASLRGDAGARALFQSHADQVVAVPSEAIADLDTPEDYQAYSSGSGKSP